MNIFSFLIAARRRSAVLTASAMIAAIALIDAHAARDLPLGFLYLFPMLLVGSVLRRWQIAGVAAICTVLAETFDEFTWGPNSGVPRDILYFAAFSSMGLFAFEATRSRRLSAEYMGRLESEITARRDAEEQLTVLVESSPAAILTANSEGVILLANDAAHRLFEEKPGMLPGRPIHAFLPALAHVPLRDDGRRFLRTAMECQGRKADGAVFQADVWFSTYSTSAGARLSAMATDRSEDLRIREEINLQQLLTGSRILVAAVSHEVRNVCGAIAMVHENLTRSGRLTGDKDFETLGTLVLALERIAAMDLRQSASQATGLDIAQLLDELRIVIDPALRDAGVSAQWLIAPGLPPVWADRHSLMQVFLNLNNNAVRAMEDKETRLLTIDARRAGAGVEVRFTDTGGGVTYPERLFHPFQQSAQASGLGLYLSRAFMRSFRGDVRYEPEANGATFVVCLSPANRESEDEPYEPQDSDIADRRPQPLPGEPEPASPDRV